MRTSAPEQSSSGSPSRARRSCWAPITGDQDLLSPCVLASAINERKDPGYDQSVVGFLMELTESLKGPQSEESIKVTTQLTELIKSLQPAALDRLLEMGGDAEKRKRFVIDASQHVAADAVLALVQAAAKASNQTISELAASPPRQARAAGREGRRAHARRSVDRDARSGRAARRQLGHAPAESGWLSGSARQDGATARVHAHAAAPASVRAEAARRHGARDGHARRPRLARGQSADLARRHRDAARSPRSCAREQRDRGRALASRRDAGQSAPPAARGADRSRAARAHLHTHGTRCGRAAARWARDERDAHDAPQAARSSRALRQ